MQFGDIAFFTGAAARERLKIDLALLPIYTGLDKLRADPDLEFGVYRGHAKLQGIKFILDGSVQARTGYFTRDYALGSQTGEYTWHGHPNISPDASRASAATETDCGNRKLVL